MGGPFITTTTKQQQQMESQKISVNGVEHPVKYGFNALRIFCEVSDLELQDLAKIESNMTMTHAVNLVWAGLKDGARVEKIEFTMTPDDVADFIDDDASVIEQCIAFFVKSFVKDNAKDVKK